MGFSGVSGHGWANDIAQMHEHYGFHDRVEQLDVSQLREMLRFRIDFLQEELTETRTAMTSADPEGVVDGLVDLIVVAIGTLDLYGVDAELAWERVHRANMAKTVGVKEGRPNPLGFPDLIKPEGWRAPKHDDNVGALATAFFE